MNKKIRINVAIYGKKVFKSKAELGYYKKYQKINLAKDLVSKIHEAVGIAEGYIPAGTVEEELKAWQHLIDTGMCWQLESWFSKQAMFLIENKLCKEKVLN